LVKHILMFAWDGPFFHPENCRGVFFLRPAFTPGEGIEVTLQPSRAVVTGYVLGFAHGAFTSDVTR
jgi:hypothetical protein